MRALPLLLLLLSVACSRSPADEAGGGTAVVQKDTPTAPAIAPKPANEPTPNPPTAPPTAETATAGGLVWAAPPPFVWKQPESSMRAAEYTVASPSGEPASLAVFYFGPGMGGTVDANIDRWVGQFTDAKGKPVDKKAKRATRKANGMAVTTVDVTGTYASAMPGAPTGPKADQRMLGAIVEGPSGPVFFKLVGPKAAVDGAEEAFTQFVDSVHPK